MTPVVRGEVHHFECRGIYNGLSLLWDRESGSYWDHVTGQAVSGELKGEKLPVYNLYHMYVETALANYPDLQVAISERDIDTNIWSPYLAESADLPPTYVPSMAEQDDRRPTMDIGLGVWTDRVHRYYPLEKLRANNNAVLDDLRGERILVYVDPLSSTPFAIRTNATGFEWQEGALRLDSGEVIRDGVLIDARGKKKSAERPLQFFTRWYGFSATFPNCEVFGQ